MTTSPHLTPWGVGIFIFLKIKPPLLSTQVKMRFGKHDFSVQIWAFYSISYQNYIFCKLTFHPTYTLKDGICKPDFCSQINISFSQFLETFFKINPQPAGLQLFGNHEFSV